MGFGSTDARYTGNGCKMFICKFLEDVINAVLESSHDFHTRNYNSMCARHKSACNRNLVQYAYSQLFLILGYML